MREGIKEAVSGLGVFAVVAIAAVLGREMPLLAGFAAVFGLLYGGTTLGMRLLPGRSLPLAVAWGTLLSISVLATVQTVWFYAGGRLDRGSDAWTLIIALGLIHLPLSFPRRRESIPKSDRVDDKWDLRRGLLAASCAVVTFVPVGYVLFAAARAATTDSIRTVWPLLPPGTLVAIALAWTGVILSAWLVKSRVLAGIQSAAAILATTAIAPLIYTLGYGFDGFLHLAGERVILATGTLSPKPLSYIGQYAFSTWVVRLTELPLALVERWLVPVASAILLPLAPAVTRRRGSVMDFAALAIIPLAAFVATTPQSFAYLLGLSAILVAAGERTDWRRIIGAFLLGAWCVAVHPLAGAPCLVIAIALSLLPGEEDVWLRIPRTVLAWILTIAAAISVPVLFAIASASGATPISWNVAGLLSPAPWTDLLASLAPWLENRFVVWSAWALLVERALPVILALFGIVTIVRERDERHRTILLLVTALLLFLASAALKTAGDFAFLIDYERGNYADRLRLIAILCLIPAALPSVSFALERMRRNALGSMALALFLAFVAASSYAALPRHDAVTVGRGWSVGQADIDAVRAIDRDARDVPYTVLANQSVSAAAVGTLGFKRYNNDIFFYPIPTGGPLYETFLRMTYRDPSNDTIAEAARQGGTDLVYVVINDYWWDAANLNERVGDIALDAWIFGNEEKGAGHSVRVYKFDVRTPKSASTAESGS